MPYTPYHDPWVNADSAIGGGDESTPIDADALNYIEAGIATAQATAEAAGGDITTDPEFDAKGDLIVGTGNNASSRLGVGNNDEVPAAASGEATGILWKKIGNAMVATDAAIAYSKLNLAASIVDADISSGAAIALSKLAQAPVVVYDRVSADTSVVSTTAETTLYSKSISANDMSTNKMLRLTLRGTLIFNNSSGDTMTYRLKFGGTTIQAIAIGSNGTLGASALPWRMVIEVSNQGATNAQVTSSHMVFPSAAANHGTNAATGSGRAYFGAADHETNHIGLIYNTAAIDTTSAATLLVSIQWSASSSSNNFTLTDALLELL